MAIIRFRGLNVSTLLVLYFTTIPIATLVSVTTLILTGSHLSSFSIFTLILGFTTLRETLSYKLSLCLQFAADGKIAIDRMQNFLMEKVTKFEGNGVNIAQNQNLNDKLSVQSCKGEKKPTVQLASYVQSDEYLSGTQTVTGTSPSETSKELASTGSFPTNSMLEEPYAAISEVSCSWNQQPFGNTLSDITLNVRNGNLLAITGAVGSGKSSLLAAILGELPLHRGEISYHGKLAYVPQIPWVFSGTIRENILFGLPFNEERFQQVVNICELTKDLRNFTNGDLTEIGQRGATLSGGQKARVGLARAVYLDADIYLLDDPLSAVDTKVGRSLFEGCILGHLSGRVRLLVTHQLQYLKDVDLVVVMENGSITHQGVYDALLDQGAFQEEIGSPWHCEDETESPKNFSSNDFNGKEVSTKGMQRDMPEGAQRQTLDQKLAEEVLHDKRIMDMLQQVSSKGKCNEAFEEDEEEEEEEEEEEAEEEEEGEQQQQQQQQRRRRRRRRRQQQQGNEAQQQQDSEAFGPYMEKDITDQEFSGPFENDPCVIAKECNNKGIMKKVLNEPSVPFLKGPPEGEDNVAFVDDLTSPKQKNEGIGVNVNDEKTAQTASSLMLSNVRDVSEADDEEPSVLDLKQDEEDKSVGTVTFRLYWKYFKQGLPVYRIILLAIALLFAQGKVNS